NFALPTPADRIFYPAECAASDAAKRRLHASRRSRNPLGFVDRDALALQGLMPTSTKSGHREKTNP
ncbi:hypothetical protein, partial [Neisseria gonorrhoeae]|uniref:hypothetical protein n=1 Tax=Neisseria gonorrhoeae TaxID=485 RepID=UPI001B7F93E0